MLGAFSSAPDGDRVDDLVRAKCHLVCVLVGPDQGHVNIDSIDDWYVLNRDESKIFGGCSIHNLEAVLKIINDWLETD